MPPRAARRSRVTTTLRRRYFGPGGAASAVSILDRYTSFSKDTSQRSLRISAGSASWVPGRRSGHNTGLDKGVAGVLGVVLVLATIGWIAAIIVFRRAAEGDGGSQAGVVRRRFMTSSEGHAARRLLAGRIDRAAYREFMAGLARREAGAPRVGTGPRSRE